MTLTERLGRAAVLGQHSPYNDPASLPYMAWATWKAMRTRCTAKISHNGEDGLRHDGTLTGVVLQLLPSVAALSDDDRRTKVDAIRYYLRTSGNARCVQWGDSKPVIWWVRPEWSETKVEPESRGFVSTYAERRVSKDEAGENRPPAPVSVRHRDAAAATLPTEDVEAKPIDPRWFAELIRWYAYSDENGPTKTILNYVAQREPEAEFTTQDVSQATGFHITTPPHILVSLRDMGLLTYTAENNEVGFTNSHRRWRISAAARKTLCEGIAQAKTSQAEVRRASMRSIEELLLSTLETDKWLDIETLAQRLFMNRGRLAGALRDLERANKALKERRAGRVTFKLSNLGVQVLNEMTTPEATKTEPTPAPAPAPAPKPAPPPAPKPADSVPSDVAGLAELLSDVISTQVMERVRGNQSELDTMTSERDAAILERDTAIAERNDAVKERDAAVEELSELRKRLDNLRKLLES